EAPQGFPSQARKAQLLPETSAENTAPDCKLIQQVKDSLRKRNEKLLLTFNDILVLQRVLFGQLYQPTSGLMKELDALAESSDSKSSQAALAALKALDEVREGNPALLIPIDATGIDPRERIYPTTFRNPFRNLLSQHQKALAALDSLETANRFTKPLAHRTFEEARRDYLGTLQAFGQIITRYKDVSMKGESVSTATIKLLAGLPPSVQRMLDSLPSTFDVVNDVVKGQEVFSNVGRVSSTSSLLRFNTAKDDNEKKVLAWGVMTDASGVMHISLRDSRPHVAALIATRHQDIAQRMTQEFLDAFAVTLNTFLAELLRIARGRHPGE
ncbi:MAG TPA: hypothetical protein VKQ72_22820, partial [Aggregatilineales bacterium]|nr:hypothetical protein [Aggregatilineales bacterium]